MDTPSYIKLNKISFIMKKIICLVISSTLFINTEAQYENKKNVGDFNGIEVSSAARVNLFQSDSNYVVLSSNGVIKKEPRMEVRGGILEVSSPFSGTINVYAKNITSIKVLEAGRLTCKDTIRSTNLSVHVSDAGKADILVHSKSIRARANDAGSVTISGGTDSLYAKASDASRINAALLKAGSAKAISSDGSNINVWAIYGIQANASDGSDIHIKGSPADKNTSASDGGSITMDDTGEETTPQYGSHKINMGGMDWRTDSNNKKKELVINGDAFVGMGFVTGGYNGAEIKYGSSREFMVGFGGTHKLFRKNVLGFDVYYRSTGYYLKQNSSKTFPDSIQHQSQKISFQNFGGLIFDRFFIGRHLFLDGGFYGDWTFHNRLVSWDDNTADVSSTKNIDRNLSFANSGNYGLTFRFGSKTGLSLYFNYRLSELFQNSSAPANVYPVLPAYVIGINLGVY
jgi:Putative auto-transporter adhesin, head GIN domain